MPGTPTPKHGLATMAGADLAATIDDTHNQAVTAIDGLMATILTGTLAGRPDSGKSGRVYLALDNNQVQVFVDTGQAWVDLATVAALAAHTAQTTQAHGGVVASSDARLTDQRVPRDGSVTPAKIAADAVTAAALAGAAGVFMVPQTWWFAGPSPGGANASTGDQVFTTRGNRQVLLVHGTGYLPGGAPRFADLLIDGQFSRNQVMVMTEGQRVPFFFLLPATWPAGQQHSWRVNGAGGFAFGPDDRFAGLLLEWTE